ncbi:hypothetical protein E1B28_003341 [Marasmius oreades]|uniref:BZIP domain-containing protein n=1 Tax=Marasmius oreades TaxID=181124 RepID=A0A9P7UMB2_9AGAR|nr:uncharacterized protein E1B28_003341 [Marasmius oreades]KAG7085801.1 hypothetical protein E1B28_003341 [Marasmius oreades]
MDSYSSLTAMANHYRIPSVLPKPPMKQPQPQHDMTAPAVQSQSQPQPLSQLAANYLSMLASKPEDEVKRILQYGQASTLATDPSPAPEPIISQRDTHPSSIPAQSPYLTSPYEGGLGDDFGTSPMLSDVNEEFISSPFSAFLDTTPLLTFDDGPVEDSPFSADLNTPIMDSYDDDDVAFDMYNGTFGGLFQDAAAAMYEQTGMTDSQKEGTKKSQASTAPFTAPVSTSSTATAAHTPTESIATPTRRSNTVHTGTRRNITPTALIPQDAPTQSRRYLTPSATSRRDDGAAKRRRLNDSAASNILLGFGEDELADEDEPKSSTHPDTDQLEKKRRQNTLAARKSRKRKLEYILTLENENSELKREVEEWKSRFEVLEGVAKAYGLALGPFASVKT